MNTSNSTHLITRSRYSSQNLASTSKVKQDRVNPSPPTASWAEMRVTSLYLFRFWRNSYLVKPLSADLATGKSPQKPFISKIRDLMPAGRALTSVTTRIRNLPVEAACKAALTSLAPWASVRVSSKATTSRRHPPRDHSKTSLPVTNAAATISKAGNPRRRTSGS